MNAGPDRQPAPLGHGHCPGLSLAACAGAHSPACKRVGYLFTDCDAIYAHTTPLDHCIGRIYHVLFLGGAALPGLVLAIDCLS